MRSRLVFALLFAAAIGCEEGEIDLLSGTPGSAGGATCSDAGVSDCGGGFSGGAGVAGAAGTAGAAGAAGTGVCVTNSDCTSGGRPFCDAPSGRCGECLRKSDCDSDKTCDSLTLS